MSDPRPHEEGSPPRPTRTARRRRANPNECWDRSWRQSATRNQSPTRASPQVQSTEHAANPRCSGYHNFGTRLLAVTTARPRTRVRSSDATRQRHLRVHFFAHSGSTPARWSASRSSSVSSSTRAEAWSGFWMAARSASWKRIDCSRGSRVFGRLGNAQVGALRPALRTYDALQTSAASETTRLSRSSRSPMHPRGCRRFRVAPLRSRKDPRFLRTAAHNARASTRRCRPRGRPLRARDHASLSAPPACSLPQAQQMGRPPRRSGARRRSKRRSVGKGANDEGANGSCCGVPDARRRATTRSRRISTKTSRHDLVWADAVQDASPMLYQVGGVRWMRARATGGWGGQ